MVNNNSQDMKRWGVQFRTVFKQDLKAQAVVFTLPLFPLLNSWPLLKESISHSMLVCWKVLTKGTMLLCLWPNINICTLQRKFQWRKIQPSFDPEENLTSSALFSFSRNMKESLTVDPIKKLYTKQGLQLGKGFMTFCRRGTKLCRAFNYSCSWNNIPRLWTV